MVMLRVICGFAVLLFCFAATIFYFGTRFSLIAGEQKNGFSSRDETNVKTLNTVAKTLTTTITDTPEVDVQYMAKSFQNWVGIYGVPPKCVVGYRLIEYNDNGDVFFNGQRTDRTPGLYCVRSDVSVIRCNTATSQLHFYNNKWYCTPRWPAIFGGRDGGDITVCGGSVFDKWSGLVYTDRLPPSNKLKSVDSDPRTERVAAVSGKAAALTAPAEDSYRWRCAGKSVDRMGNPYLESPSDRLTMVRNSCAKYVYQAVSQIAPSTDRPGFCDCLANGVHGATSVTSARFSTPLPGPTEQLISVPHACSPCVAGGGPDNDSYVVKLVRGCVKSYWKTVNNSSEKDTLLDQFPCGTKNFNERNAACTSASVYVGVGLSEYGRRLVNRKTLW